MRGTYRYLTVEEVSTPRAMTVIAYQDYWWATTADGKVAMYLVRPNGEEHPQCNANRALVERMATRSDEVLTGEPVQIPWAFSVHRCEQ